MTPIRSYNDPWDGAVHPHRAAPGTPAGAPRGWLDGPLPSPPPEGSAAAPTTAASDAPAKAAP